MKSKYPGRLDLDGTEVCSEDGCGRPAVDGIERIDGTIHYDCEAHREIDLLNGKLDWLYGEIIVLEDWREQALKQAETHREFAARNGLSDGPSFLVLTDENQTNKERAKDAPIFDPWVIGFESLLAAIGEAEKETKKEIARKEAALEK